MRARALVSLALVFASGAARAQHVTSSPPPLRTFGPDSTATGVFTGAGLTPPGLTCDAPPAPATQTCTGYLASSGGCDRTRPRPGLDCDLEPQPARLRLSGLLRDGERAVIDVQCSRQRGGRRRGVTARGKRRNEIGFQAQDGLTVSA